MAGSDIGRRIAAARRERGLTQEELAERIGVMLGTLEAYEGGRADPSRHLDRISAATGKEALWFLRGDPPEDIGALLQRHAAELGKREDELALASERAEARLREYSEAERRHEEASAALALMEQTLKQREAELDSAGRTLRETSKVLADRAAALERRERELEASRQRHAEDSPREQALDNRPSTFEEEKRRFEEARAEREQSLVDLLERVRRVAAQLQAQRAERDAEVGQTGPPSRRMRCGPSSTGPRSAAYRSVRPSQNLGGYAEHRVASWSCSWQPSRPRS